MTTMLLGLASGLTKLGHQVVVYGHGGQEVGDAPRESLRVAESAGVEIRVRRPGVRPSRFSASLGIDPIVTLIATNEDRLDLVVIHGMFGAYSGRIVRACAKARIPAIACPHDPYSPEVFGTRTAAKRAYWRLREAPFLRKAQAIHVLAPSHIAYLRCLGVHTPCFVVPNGVDRGWLKPVAPKEVDPPKRRVTDEAGLVLVYLGRWDVYNKGLDLVLMALADPLVRSTTRLLIAGRAREREREQLEWMISSLRLKDQVSLLGYVDDRQWLIRSADALILPSRFDGFGQVVIESIAAGTPAIVSSKAGASEFLGPEHGIVLVEPNISSLIQGIRTMAVSRNGLRRCAQSSGDYLAHEFTWARLARRWTDEVERLGFVGNPPRT